VGFAAKTIQAPAGAAENQPPNFLSSLSGLFKFANCNPTVSPWATIGRCSTASEQILKMRLGTSSKFFMFHLLQFD
jgi:hypothetical protein